ncbi:MAG: DUF2088 domain-containing protein [Chloroflexi bacterium]|nr:DUF2088 domain-containing protein [Chloroflexota bacterium]
MTGGETIIASSQDLSDVRVAMVRQLWRQPSIDDVPGEVLRQLERTGALARINPGDEIAITAGSRGIATMPVVLCAIVDAVRSRGGRPFIFPAMGSHGGGTAEGQRALLAELGIDETTMGAPIKSEMTVVQIGETPAGLPVFLDAQAAQAKGIIMVNRIKKHTSFDADRESGLCKMAVIGMGKHRQAVTVHRYGNAGLARLIPEVAAVVFAQAPILAGLALVENARGGLARLEGLRREEILDAEPALLRQARELSPKIPFHQIDIGIVEQLGKNISGTGMDCYVIGRKRVIGEPEWPEAPDIHSLVVLRVTAASKGNALGVGLADFTTRELVDAIDWPAVRANVLASGNMERGKIPFAYDTDREAVEAAGFRERLIPPRDLRLIAVQDTLHLEYLLVSESMLTEVANNPDLEVVSDLMALPFDQQGRWHSPLPQR